MTPDNESALDAHALQGIAQRTAELRSTRRAQERAIVAARKRNLPVREIAKAAGVSPQTVLNIVARFTAAGD